MTQSISKQALQRLPTYLTYLRSLPKDEGAISATAIAEALGLGEVQVRKDLAFVSNRGKPKIGYVKSELIYDLEQFLGYNDVTSAILIGAGQLGKALLSYEGFSNYGINIIAAFDSSPVSAHTVYCGKQIFPMEKLPNLCQRFQVHIGVITVPADQAQSVCDLLVRYGVKAIWNFAPALLHVPDGILVQNENMAASLAVLSNHLSEIYSK